MKVYHKSTTDEWRTPFYLFKYLDAKYKFTLDAAASEENALCQRYYTESYSALDKCWKGERVFCNPPYSTTLQNAFVKKAYDEYIMNDTLTVLLLPARVSTERWHNYIFSFASEILFIKGRIKFTGADNGAPFPSAIVVFSNKKRSFRRSITLRRNEMGYLNDGEKLLLEGV